MTRTADNTLISEKSTDRNVVLMQILRRYPAILVLVLTLLLSACGPNFDPTKDIIIDPLDRSLRAGDAWKTDTKNAQHDQTFNIPEIAGVLNQFTIVPFDVRDVATVADQGINAAEKQHNYLLRFSLNPKEGTHFFNLVDTVCNSGVCSEISFPLQIQLDQTAPRVRVSAGIKIKNGMVCVDIQSDEPNAPIQRAGKNGSQDLGLTRPDGSAPDVCFDPSGLGQNTDIFRVTDPAGNEGKVKVEYDYQPAQGVKIISTEYDVQTKKMIIRGVWQDPGNNLSPETGVACEGDGVLGTSLSTDGNLQRFANGTFTAVCDGPLFLGDIRNGKGTISIFDAQGHKFELPFDAATPEIPFILQAAILTVLAGMGVIVVKMLRKLDHKLSGEKRAKEQDKDFVRIMRQIIDGTNPESYFKANFRFFPDRLKDAWKALQGPVRDLVVLLNQNPDLQTTLAIFLRNAPLLNKYVDNEAVAHEVQNNVIRFLLEQVYANIAPYLPELAKHDATVLNGKADFKSQPEMDRMRSELFALIDFYEAAQRLNLEKGLVSVRLQGPNEWSAMMQVLKDARTIRYVLEGNSLRAIGMLTVENICTAIRTLCQWGLLGDALALVKIYENISPEIRKSVSLIV